MYVYIYIVDQKNENEGTQTKEVYFDVSGAANLFQWTSQGISYIYNYIYYIYIYDFF